jgi:hypothetical protein
VGGSIACLVTAFNTSVTASISPKPSVVQPGRIIAADPVKPLEVGTYAAMKAKAVTGDGLTPDHIPSFAAVREFRAKARGRDFTAAEEAQLRNDTNTIVYLGKIHEDFSRTFKGKNNQIVNGKPRYEVDAQNLKAAFAADKATLRPELIKIYDAAKVDAAFDALNKLNIKSGLYQ